MALIVSVASAIPSLIAVQSDHGNRIMISGFRFFLTNDSLRIFFGIWGAACMIGCATTGVRDTATTNRRVGTPVVSPLAVTVEEPAALARVNAVAILSPSVDQSVKGAYIDEVRFVHFIESAAEQELDLKIISNSWLRKTIPKVTTRPSKTEREVLLASGVNGLLLGELLSFSERTGSSVGGEPATVAFRLGLLDVSSGKSVWQATYALREEALTDNLFKIGDRLGKEGSGVGWSSASSKLQKGLLEALRDLRTRREQLFFKSAK